MLHWIVSHRTGQSAKAASDDGGKDRRSGTDAVRRKIGISESEERRTAAWVLCEAHVFLAMAKLRQVWLCSWLTEKFDSPHFTRK